MGKRVGSDGMKELFVEKVFGAVVDSLDEGRFLCVRGWRWFGIGRTNR